MPFKCLKRVIPLDDCMVNIHMVPLYFHLTGEVQFMTNLQVFDATRAGKFAESALLPDS